MGLKVVCGRRNQTLCAEHPVAEAVRRGSGRKFDVTGEERKVPKDPGNKTSQSKEKLLVPALLLTSCVT